MIRCGMVPNITVSLFPVVSINTPTSPTGPHCIAKPENNYILTNVYSIFVRFLYHVCFYIKN